VSYTLDNDDALKVEMRATTDSTTLVNLAQHTYWNLGGEGSGSVLDHELTLESDAYTPGDPQIPDGRVLSVDGTAFDFTRPKALRADIAGTGLSPAGFDHNFVVRGEPHAMRPVARLVEPRSGRVMTLEANQPGVQLYTGNHLKGAFSGKTTAYAQYAGLCLETQAFPDAVNVPAWRGDVLLSPGAEYRHDMRFRFSTVASASTPGRI
jgi:aldose 1-epimerase